jgi:hypothetical protein
MKLRLSVSTLCIGNMKGGGGTRDMGEVENHLFI